MPFARSSTTFSREIIPLTPLTSVTCPARSPHRSIAVANSSRILIGTRCEQVLPALQAGQISPSTSRLHRGQRKTGWVWAPQSHRFRNVTAPQLGHRRSPTSAVMTPPSMLGRAAYDEASWMERREPPASPTGNRAWGGGFISRGFDFPGLPIRPPMRVPPFARILIPERCWRSTSASSPGALSQEGRCRNRRSSPVQASRTRHGSTTISPSRIRWRTSASSRIRFMSGLLGRWRAIPSRRPLSAIQSARVLIRIGVRSSRNGWNEG
ncbi:hypothetical protein DSECCO2_609970 [anaerobic digester metagenome]